MTSPLASDFNTIKTEAPQISLPKVIKLEYTELDTTQPEVT